MAELYRKSALEKMSSPEQLDVPLKVTSPLSWLALLGATILVTATVYWSIAGRLPITVTANGIVVSPSNTNSVYTDWSGTVTEVFRQVGEKIWVNDPILKIDTVNGRSYTVLSDQVGYISEIITPENSQVKQNSEVVRISPEVGSAEQVVVCYVPLADVKKIDTGMDTFVYLSAADSQRYGHMVGRVINIDSKPTSISSQSYVVGSDNNMASVFSSNNGAVAAVTCELLPDKSSGNGFYWSNEKGTALSVSSGSLCQVRIITKEIRPIEKLFERLTEIWEGK